MNVLITNIGRRGYLVDFLRNTKGFTGNIFVSDCDPTASGLYGDNDGYFILSKPVGNEQKYISELIELCLNENIKIIIPVIDPEIFLLSEHRDEFIDKGILLVVSEKRVLDICYNKILMNEFLECNNFRFPKTYQTLESFKKANLNKEVMFPAILKPIYGSGSEATYKVDSMEKIDALFNDKMIIQEFIDGQEYGADIFNTLEKKPVRCVIKKKISMRSGETDKAITVIDNNIRKYMISLAESLGHIGNLDCDVIIKDGEIYVIDLNPRFGGGYPATHAAGVNLLSLILKLYDQINIEPEFDNYESDLLVMKEISIVTARL